MKEALLSILVAVIAYLLGCFSTGTLVSKSQGVNIRDEGSKNTGASNVLRVLGLKSGLVTFVGDFLKATLACWLGSVILPGSVFSIDGYGMMLGGLFAIIGHNWPVFYHFKGGKGVASSVAVIIFVNPLLGVLSVLACIAVIAITKFVSAGSMTMLLCYMILTCATHWGQWAVCLFSVLLFALCIWRHRSNIQRLMNGTESKLGQHVTPKTQQDTKEDK